MKRSMGEDLSLFLKFLTKFNWNRSFSLIGRLGPVGTQLWSDDHLSEFTRQEKKNREGHFLWSSFPFQLKWIDWLKKTTGSPVAVHRRVPQKSKQAVPLLDKSPITTIVKNKSWVEHVTVNSTQRNTLQLHNPVQLGWIKYLRCGTCVVMSKTPCRVFILFLSLEYFHAFWSRVAIGKHLRTSLPRLPTRNMCVWTEWSVTRVCLSSW